MSIEIANESGVDVGEEPIVAVARYALERMAISPLAELSIILVELEAMSELHERWMEEPGPTDVMSFPMDELDSAKRPDAPISGPALLGDIVLCPAFARDQAAAAGHTLDDELHLLTVHGVLHLLGYDHADADEEREMFGLQGELLGAWRAERDARERAERADAAERERTGRAEAAERERAARRAEADRRRRDADDRLLGTVGLEDGGTGR